MYYYLSITKNLAQTNNQYVRNWIILNYRFRFILYQEQSTYVNSYRSSPSLIAKSLPKATSVFKL